ncbi:MAG: histidine kinase [Ginsengibacter sp.]
MQSLTLKIFFKDLLFLIVAFFILMVMFVVMVRFPGQLRSDLFLKDFDLQALITLIYGNVYCVLFYHLFFKKLLLRASVKKALNFFFILTICYFITDMFFLNLMGAALHQWDHIIWFDVTSIFRFLLFTVYAIVYSLIKGLTWLRLQKVKSEKEIISASLSQLRSKIDPHFVFNSLNTAYALSMEENAFKTSASIEDLSGLFRYSLAESTGEYVPIQKELEFIEKYIHLHKIRINESEKIKITTSILWDKTPADIVPMLLINFIENAFKYGISAREPSFIEINLSIKNKKLNLIIKNSMHVRNNIGKNGIGLKNSLERLDLLYHDKYTLQQKEEKTIHEIILNISLD